VPQINTQQAQMQQAIQQQLAPVTQFMAQMEQAKAEQEERNNAQAEYEVEQFLERAEFGEDVRDTMADLIQVARWHNRELSLPEAYRQACIGNDRIRQVLDSRAKQRGTQQLSGAAQRAKAAAVSVSGAPALAGPSAEPDSIRAAIEMAIAANSR